MKAQRKEQVSGLTVKVIKKTPLTKAEMVNKIQLAEAAMFLELKKAEQEHGSDSRWTGMLRSQWNTVNELMLTLGIDLDFRLPDNQEATAIICERDRKLQAS